MQRPDRGGNKNNHTDDSEDNHERDEYENIGDGEQLSQNSQSRKGASNGGNSECSSASRDDPTVLEMIIVKDVKSGAEGHNEQKGVLLLQKRSVAAAVSCCYSNAVLLAAAVAAASC